MTSKAKIIGSTDPTQPETAVEEREGLLDSTREQEIRIRAYEIYLSAGDNLAMNWRIGFILNVSSRNESAYRFSRLQTRGAHKVMQFAAKRSAQTSALSRGANRLNEGSRVVAAKNEHSTAFATLSDQHREQLFRAAHRITRAREDAEDAVQDGLLRAFVHMGDFEGRSNFGTWLTSITINSALMILRRKRATREAAMGDNNDFGDGLRYEITNHAPNPEIRYAQTEELRILRTAIHRRRPNLRVVVHFHLQGRSMRETAEALGISLSAAKGRLFHAKNALRKSAPGRVADQPRFPGKSTCLVPGLLGDGHPNLVSALGADSRRTLRPNTSGTTRIR